MSGRSPRWFTGIKRVNNRLPNGYKELTYIESSDGEYINTGISVDATNYNKLKFVIDCEILGQAASSVSEWFLDGSNTNGAYFYMGQFAGTYYYGCGGSTDRSTSISTVSGRHTFTLDAAKKEYTISGVLDITATVAEVTTSAPLILFGFSSGSSVTVHREKLYSAQIYQGSALLRDFVPCRKRSNQQVGLFDLVTQTFFENAGFGSFIAGEAA